MDELKQIKYNRLIFNYLLNLKPIRFYVEYTTSIKYFDKEMNLSILTVNSRGFVVGHRIDKMCKKLNIEYSDAIINIKEQINNILKINFL